MSFTTYGFIFVFLPVTVLGSLILGRIRRGLWQKLWLIAASCVFYAWASPPALLWLLFSGAVSYGIAVALFRLPGEKTPKKRILLGIGIVFHVALLGFFKYFDLSSLRAALPERGALFFLVPMGVSFFTFQLIVFLIEIYRGKDAPGSVLDFALYLTFFPYRTMGPIMFHSDFAGQLKEKTALRVTSDGLGRGLYQFLLGLTKKVVLADTIAIIANNGFSGEGELALATAWATSLAYTFQLYFDFSGYSDMAIGIGRMLGMRLPLNFDSPYRSESVSVFWRRWHATLGKALTTSVYISLGGNRCSKARTCFNLFAVMIISGIWHGESLNFLIWGAAYGLLLVFERLAMPALEKIPLFLRRIGTFLVVNFLWVIFRAPDLSGAVRVWRGMVNVKNPGIGALTALAQDGIMNLPSFVAIPYVLALLALCGGIAFFFKKNSNALTDTLIYRKRTVVLLSVLFVLCLIHLSRAGVFLYENF